MLGQLSGSLAVGKPSFAGGSEGSGDAAGLDGGVCVLHRVRHSKPLSRNWACILWDIIITLVRGVLADSWLFTQEPLNRNSGHLRRHLPALIYIHGPETKAFLSAVWVQADTHRGASAPQGLLLSAFGTLTGQGEKLRKL